VPYGWTFGSLNHEIAVVDDGLRLAIDKVGSVGNGVFAPDHLAMTVSDAKDPEVFRIESLCDSTAQKVSSAGIQRQFSLMLKSTKKREITGLGRYGHQNEREPEKTSEVFHSA